MKRLTIVAALALLAAACGKAEDSTSDSSESDSSSKSKSADSDKASSSSSKSDGTGSESSSTSTSDTADNPWDDPAKPVLDDKKLDGFIGSLKDPNGPFEAVSKGKVTAFNAEKRMDEFEAAARKHGFAGGEEYLGYWLRINAVNGQIMQEESNEFMIKAQEEGIKNRREMLKKPDLTPELRQQVEEGIKASEETIKVLRQPREGGINAQDVESFKKHRKEFEEAMKTWTK
jgi:hypothetical protein